VKSHKINIVETTQYSAMTSIFLDEGAFSLSKK